MGINKEKFPITFTLLRILLAPIVMLFILKAQNTIPLILFILTALIAFLDGFLAGKRIKDSQLRMILDDVADKLLINLSLIAFFINGILPLWIMLIFLIRDSLILIGGACLLFRNIKTEFKPSVLGNITLFFQIIFILVILLGRIDPILLWITIILTITSGIYLAIKSKFRLAKKTDLGEFSFRKLIKPQDLLTLLNVTAGFISILFTLNGAYFYAIMMMIMAVLFDYADGKIARLTKNQHDFGKQLDSLADTISFGVAPAVFGFSLVKTQFALIAFSIFLFCGVLRLARYNIMITIKEYKGLPITVNGIIIPIIYFINVPLIYYPYIYLTLGILMISSITVKKVM